MSVSWLHINSINREPWSVSICCLLQENLINVIRCNYCNKRYFQLISIIAQLWIWYIYMGWTVIEQTTEVLRKHSSRLWRTLEPRNPGWRSSGVRGTSVSTTGHRERWLSRGHSQALSAAGATSWQFYNVLSLGTRRVQTENCHHAVYKSVFKVELSQLIVIAFICELRSN